MPLCSIIIPVYNKANLTRQCLEGIFACATPTCSFEVIVVDDGSRDATQRMLASYGDRVRVVTHATNKAFATSCNDGAAAATGKYLVFLNNDTAPFAGWLEALVRYKEAHPRADLVGARLLYPNRTIQHAGLVIPHDRIPRHVYLGFPADHPLVNKPRRMQAVTGACHFIARELFLVTGGYDTAFINGYEDVDLCMRLGAMGHEIHYCPESTLIHLESVSEGRNKYDDHGSALFLKRWGKKIQPDDLLLYAEDGLIQVNYHATLEFTIAPELGVIRGQEGFADADRLLRWRAIQVHSLLRENSHLRAASASALLGAARAG
jgi:GT2 family glycosyltransferase